MRISSTIFQIFDKVEEDCCVTVKNHSTNGKKKTLKPESLKFYVNMPCPNLNLPLIEQNCWYRHDRESHFSLPSVVSLSENSDWIRPRRAHAWPRASRVYISLNALDSNARALQCISHKRGTDKRKPFITHLSGNYLPEILVLRRIWKNYMKNFKFGRDFKRWRSRGVKIHEDKNVVNKKFFFLI